MLIGLLITWIRQRTLLQGFAKEIAARYNRDPYNMLEKIGKSTFFAEKFNGRLKMYVFSTVVFFRLELPGFWGVKNVSEINLGVPGQVVFSSY